MGRESSRRFPGARVRLTPPWRERDRLVDSVILGFGLGCSVAAAVLSYVLAQ